MSIVLFVILIILVSKNKQMKKELHELQHLAMNPQPSSMPAVDYSPEFIGQEAENLRRAEESALRTKAETLLPNYEKSELVRDLLKKIQEAMGYEDLIWDVELHDNEIVLTTMTDAMEDRMVLVRDFYDFQTLGYEAPSMWDASIVDVQ